MPQRATNPWVVLVLVCLAQFMVILDATVVNVARPSIQRDLEMSEADLQWIVNSYTLVFGGFVALLRKRHLEGIPVGETAPVAA